MFVMCYIILNVIGARNTTEESIKFPLLQRSSLSVGRLFMNIVFFILPSTFYGRHTWKVSLMLKTCQASLPYLLNGTCFIFAKTLRLSDSIWSILADLIRPKNVPLTLRRQIRKQIMASEKRSVLDGDFSPLMRRDWSGPNKEVECGTLVVGGGGDGVVSRDVDVSRRDVTWSDVMEVAGGSHGDLVAALALRGSYTPPLPSDTFYRFHISIHLISL